MPSSKKPRRAHRPTARTGALPIVFAVPREAALGLKIEPHTALEKLRRGMADADDVRTLGSRLNLAALCTQRLAHDPASQTAAREVITAAVLALQAVRERYRATGRMGVSGDQFRALSEALVLADDLHDLSTRRELRDDLAALRRLADSPGCEGDLIDVDLDEVRPA